MHKSPSVTLTISQVLQQASDAYHTGKLSVAENLCYQILDVQPEQVDAIYLLGLIAEQKQDDEMAALFFQQAIQIDSSVPQFYDSLGQLFQAQGKWVQMIGCYQRAVILQPQEAHFYYQLGNAFTQLARWTEALSCYQRATTLNPKFAEAYNALGNALRYQGQLQQAVKCYQQAIALEPQEAWFHSNLACSLHDQGKIQESLEQFKQALELDPSHIQAHHNLLLALNYLEEVDPQTLFTAHCQFHQHHAASIIPFTHSLPLLHLQRRLKIGYLSQDFKRHSVAYFLESILAHHDPRQVEIFCYDDGLNHDEVTQRFQRYADHWVSCVSLSDEALAEKIYQAGIDILVDLMGHTGHRLLVLARKPAPIQITYLGYPTTTGLTAIDYRLTDRFVDPEAEHETLNSESLLRMPNSYFCYRPAQEAVQLPVHSLPVLENGFITFASFNNATKFSPTLLKMWAELLHALPHSRLLLKSSTRHQHDHQMSRLFEEHFAQMGIAPERIVQLPYMSEVTDHLKAYHHVDIALDSYPYNGATTTCEALFMGVPVVTLVGKTHVSRMGASLLSALGLTETIAYTPKEYIDIGIKLARDIERLQHLRSTLREQMSTSPLMDAGSFTRHLENLYRQIWERRCVIHAPMDQEALSHIIQRALRAHQVGELTQAEYLYQHILRHHPHHLTALHSLGILAAQTQRESLAAELFHQAIAVNPTLPICHQSLGHLFSHQHHYAEAAQCYQQAVHLDPRDAEHYSYLAYVLRTQGQINEAVNCYHQALQLNPDPVTYSDLLFTLQYAPHLSAEELYAQHLEFEKRYTSQIERMPLSRQPFPNKRLKIGYVSAHLRQHSVGYFIEPILAHHDSDQFEIFCYDNHPEGDEVTRRFQSYADHWLNTAHLTDEALAARMRQDDIDILVDLACHMRGNRLTVFARKPAPIQITYLGHPTTTGLRAMDYKLTDGHADPTSSETVHSEQLLRLPHSFYCYAPPREAPPVQALPMLHHNRITFGSFNALIKMNSSLFELWARLLQTIPHAHLLLKTHALTSPQVRQRIIQHFSQLGIDETRLTLLGWERETSQHLALYHQIDIALDTFPYNGGTTTCEALWMGVPTLTLVGDRTVSRMGASILSAVGLPHFIAHTTQEYIDLAVTWSQQKEALQHLREHVRERMIQSPLMDAPNFTRQVEFLYREVWTKWCSNRVC